MAKYVVGMDIGGTNIRIAIQQEGGAVEYFRKIPRESVLTGRDTAKRLGGFILEYCRTHIGEHLPQAIVIGFPATLDAPRRRILQAPNIPGLDGFSAEELEKMVGIPVYFERDVNLLFYCDMEDLHLLPRGISVGVYVGTGIGNAIFYEGRPLPGKNGVSGELGHIPKSGALQKCGCGNIGCSECFGSGLRLVAIRQDHFPDTPLDRLFTEKGNELVIREFVEEIACTVAAEVNILDPEQLVLGGGVLNMPDFPMEELERRILAHTRWPFPAKNLVILRSQDTVENGVRGALALGWSLINYAGEETA